MPTVFSSLTEDREKYDIASKILNAVLHNEEHVVEEICKVGIGPTKQRKYRRFYPIS
jgi:hypothetical protein